MPLMRCIREKMPELRELRILVDAPEEKGDGYVETLWRWEDQGFGWVVEQKGGCIYLESRRDGNPLVAPRQRSDGFM